MDTGDDVEVAVFDKVIEHIDFKKVTPKQITDLWSLGGLLAERESESLWDSLVLFWKYLNFRGFKIMSSDPISDKLEPNDLIYMSVGSFKFSS